jgi:hypothetical protein
MAFTSLKVLTAISYGSTNLQATVITLNAEIKNITRFVEELHRVEDRWDSVLYESRTVTENIWTTFSNILPAKRRKVRKGFEDKTTEETINFNSGNHLEHTVFCIILDCVLGYVVRNYEAVL